MTDATARTRLWTRLGPACCAVFWATATVPLALDAAQVVRTHTTTRVLGAPTDAVIVQVQQERALSAGHLAGVVDQGALTAQRARTDEAYQRLRDALDGPMRRTMVGADAARQTDELLRRLDDRARLRAIVDAAVRTPARRSPDTPPSSTRPSARAVAVAGPHHRHRVGVVRRGPGPGGVVAGGRRAARRVRSAELDQAARAG